MQKKSRNWILAFQESKLILLGREICSQVGDVIIAEWSNHGRHHRVFAGAVTEGCNLFDQVLFILAFQVGE